MSWQNIIPIMVRYLINDVNPSAYKYTDARIEKTILISSYIVNYDASFLNEYNIDISNETITPDPTEIEPKDEAFIVLTAYKTACVILGSELKTEAGNAISVRDGQSSIDLRGISSTLSILYKDLCLKYENFLFNYKDDITSLAGQAILGPYSPGADFITRTHNDYDHRGNYFRY